MTEQALTDTLAERVTGWKAAPDDEDKILRALHAEAERLRNISALIDFGQLSSSVDSTRIRSGEY